MEYLNAGNIVTAIVVLLMISCVVKFFFTIKDLKLT